MTSGAVALRGDSPLASIDRFTTEDIELMRETVCKGASDAEFRLFLNQCVRTGLDPLAKQVYSIPRGNTRTIQTGIDGYRLIAQRTGEYAGSDDPVYDDEDAEQPKRATVTVWRFVQGERVPFTATARWSEYKPAAGQDQMWLKMPFLMLAKCSEGLALRKAFPQELSGIYTDAEMDQAVELPPPRVLNVRTGEPVKPKPQPVRATIMNTPRKRAPRETPIGEADIEDDEAATGSAAARQWAKTHPANDAWRPTSPQVALFWTAGEDTGWSRVQKRDVMRQLHPALLDPKRGEVSVLNLTRAQFDDLIGLFSDTKMLSYDADGKPLIVDAGPPAEEEGAQTTEA